MDKQQFPDRRSFFFPILLIALGIVFLLKNIGLLTGDVWDILLRLWPLLLVALGLDSALRRHGLVGPIFLIGVGAVFLLSNFGLLDLNVWELIIRLWPLLLIAIGLDIAIGHRSALWSLVGLFILIAILAGMLWLYGLRQQGGMLSSTKHISQPLQGAQHARIEINLPIGSLRLKSSSNSENLIQGNIYLGQNEDILTNYSVDDGLGIFTLRSSGTFFFTIPTRRDDRWYWDLEINPSILIDLNVNMGAGILHLDLSKVTMDAFQIDIGIGHTTIALGKDRAIQGKIDGAIGQTEILIPDGAGVRIHADTGLTRVLIPEDFQKGEGIYTSPGYETASVRVNLDVSQAIGVIRIRYVGK